MAITAFVTGASSGFGAAITDRLAAVVASARRADLLVKAATDHPGTVHPLLHPSDPPAHGGTRPGPGGQRGLGRSFAAFQVHRRLPAPS